VTFLHQVTLGSSRRGVPRTDDDVTVAAGAIVIGAVVLGRGCTVGAGAVVLKSVEPLAVVAGNPATVVGRDAAPRTQNPAPRP
jgi:serine O-acetyltransferase